MKSTLWLFNFFFCLRGDLACNIALDAVQTVARDQGDRKEIDIKNYAKVEKVRGFLGPHFIKTFDKIDIIVIISKFCIMRSQFSFCFKI